MPFQCLLFSLYLRPTQAYTISIADLRRSVEAPDDTVRVIPLLEREERIDAQKFRLSGLDLEAF